MKKALIGYTGFVGRNLDNQYDFDFHFNSKNFLKMKDQKYELIVCAGVSAVKWMANDQPENDRSQINALCKVLASVEAKQFVLISTIDVYPLMEHKDESFDCSSIENHAYGMNRLNFENFCVNQFPNCTIVRLPGLFGYGLKKNVIFDLLNSNLLEKINPSSSFQYYYLDNLWNDIEVALANNLKLVNLFTEPILTSDILERHFSDKVVGKSAYDEQHYNLFTKYAKHWGKSGNYIYDKAEVMHQLSEFIANYMPKQKK